MEGNYDDDNNNNNNENNNNSSNNKLKQLWQSCQINSSNDPEEKRKHLIKLLDCCLIYFNELNPEQECNLNHSDLSKTTQYYIGNWLIHQFIIDLSDLGNSPTTCITTEPEYRIFYEYFMNGIGWKLLRCFSYFNHRNGSIYNAKFAKILIILLKTFMLNYNDDDEKDALATDQSNRNQDEWLSTNMDLLFLSNTNLKEDVYLKTLKNESLSPAKVKSWMKNSRNLNKLNRRKHQNIYQFDSDEQEEEDFDFNENLYKARTKNHEIFPFYKAHRLKQQLSTESQRTGEDDHQTTKSDRPIIKPTMEELISIVQNVLGNSILFEHSNNEEQAIIARIVIEELSPLVGHLVDSIRTKNLKKPRFRIVEQLKNLVILSCLVVCVKADGIKLMHQFNVIKSLIKYIDFLQTSIKEPLSDQGNNFISVLITDYNRTLCLLISTMITVSQSLVCTKEIHIFQSFMEQIFEKKMENMAQFLMKHNVSQNNGLESIFRFVDLLKELQISIQYSQSLLLHKRVCTKKRHKRCDLVQLMAHHFFHQVFGMDSGEDSGEPKTAATMQCISSLVYCLMIKLILFCSNQPMVLAADNGHNGGDDERMICYISNQLSMLISCCCSLKKYCKNLLHLAIGTNRTNGVRNAIFNIIEFNVKIQRKHFSDATFLTDQCSFCTYHDICEKDSPPSIASEDLNNDSIYSEGYSTDNCHSSIEEKLKFSTININCSDTNCLIKSLSAHYITLMKCENTATRQTVFKHLFNLFSYLNLKSRKSILLHVIFPIFEHHQNYPPDVSYFVLRLLIAITKQTGDRQSDNVELLNLFVKSGVLPAIKQFICLKKPFRWSNNDGNIDDNFLVNNLSVELMKNLIKCELMHFARMTAHSSTTDPTEMVGKIDFRSFNMIGLLVEMFLERFDELIKPKTIQYFDKKATTLKEYIDLYKEFGFNIIDLNETESGKLFNNLWCLLKLLSISNNILAEFPYFRIILNHDDFNFASQLIKSFQKFTVLTLNEIKLFYCLNFDMEHNVHDHPEIEKQKCRRFCEKLLQVLEQMMFLTAKIEPFDLHDMMEYQGMTKFIENQLRTFVEPNLLRWTCSKVNLMAELLKILIRLAFDSNENLDLNGKHNYNEYSSLEMMMRQHRTSSFDSVTSGNETNNELEFDHESDGYEADTECLKNATNEAINNDKNQEWKHSKVSYLVSNVAKKQSRASIKNVDLCKIVFKYLSGCLFERNFRIDQQSSTGHDSPLKHDLDVTLQIVNLVAQYCRDDADNGQKLFDNDFTRIIIEDFKFLLIAASFEEKPVKIALFELFIQITASRLGPREIKMFIELFKNQDSDFEFLLSIFNKLLFTKHRPQNPPQSYLRFPASRIKSMLNETVEQDWIDRVIENINDNYTNCEYDIGFKSFACALPLSPSNRHVQLKYSLVFWIHLEKLPSLVTKYPLQVASKRNVDGRKNFRIKNVRHIHIVSLVFDCVTLELWFDYVYNRFIYRICKESNGKMIYLNESFVPCNPSLLGQWTFINIDLQEKCDPSNRSHSIQIGHNVNCSREKVFKWSYPAALFNGDSKNNAVFVGSAQDISDYHYDLSQVALFKDNLTQTALMILYAMGPDFENYHHLENETIQQHGYFVLPHRLVNETNLEMLSTLLQSSVATESRLILDNLILVYKASKPNIFFAYQHKDSMLNASANPFKLLSSGNQMKKSNQLVGLDEAKVFPVKLNTIMNIEHNQCCIAKIISDSGGVSILIFLFLYLLEKSDNPVVFNKSLELILNVYDMHYYHKTMFDNHYRAYELLLYVWEKSRKPFTPMLLKTYSKFVIHNKENQTMILSENIATFLHSWKICIKNLQTSRQFFQLLNSLVLPSNPYRNFNLIYLKKMHAFSHFIHMIEDIYLDYFDDYPRLDLESLQKLFALLHTMIENVSDFNLIKIVLNCLLLLQNSEWLHVNQTKASFYYLFPSTWLTLKEEDHLNIEKVAITKDHPEEFTSNEQIGDDWEIVSEFLENASPLSSEPEEEPPQRKITTASSSSTTTSPSSFKHGDTDIVSCELILMIYQYLDQIPDVHLLDSIFRNVSCLDFLIVLVNSPSDNVRSTALKTFFKLFKLHYDKKESSPEFQPSSLDARVLKEKTLHLLMVSNQLYNHVADDMIVKICLSFLLNLNSDRVYDLLNRDCDQTLLKKMCAKISLENFIPLLALLPRCISSIGFCHKILRFFHQIIRKMSIQQINELQKEYGLVQSLSKLVINLNTQLSIQSEDMNKFTKEHLNEEIYRIVHSISLNYMLNNDPQYYINFLNFVNYFSIIERKVAIEVSQVFRRIQVSIYQASFEAIEKFQVLFDGKKQLTSNDYCIEDLNKPLRLSSSPLSSSFDFGGIKSRPFGIQPKVMLERLKTLVKNAILFIMCRNHKIPLSEKEKFFQREVLYHLLKIIGQCENLVHGDHGGKNAWTKMLANSKDYFKSHLNRIVLFLMSHLQSIDDRIFSLNLLFEKTREFENIKLFVDKNDDRFAEIFHQFLMDVIENGIKELNIYSASKADEFGLPNRHECHGDDIVVPQPSLSMEYVCTKFKQQFKICNSVSSIAVWHEQTQELILKYENEILRSTNKVFSNMSLVFQKVLDAAKSLNNRIIPAQNKEKKNYLLHLKQEQLKSKTIEKRLMRLIGQLLHEKSCWFLKEYYPESWELSPFESNGRIRKKLERCFLDIDNRYVRNANCKRLRSKHLFSTFLENDSKIFHSIRMNEFDGYRDEDGGAPLLYLASVILYDEQIVGEILIKKTSIQFMASVDDPNENYSSFSSKKVFFRSFVIDFNEIQEIIKCRYELQNIAMEIVLISGLTYLIAFESTTRRDECFNHLMSNNRDLLPNLTEGIKLVTLTQMWRERLISNFDYLMQLNKLSGRTFNDLMQYPVFPFVLADYSSDILNLLDPSSFRDLSRPIAVQKKEREKYYIDQYNYIKMENSLSKDRDRNDINSFQFIVTAAPYHYGAHYSNSGIVLYYLVRLPPYTQMFLQYQDKNFDIPDRSFHSIQTTWRLATEDSTNGFKELIPEFFYLPEFLMNMESFNLGVRQNGERVDNVILPPWCRNDARLFTLINLQALESNHVTQHLNHWIDLIFGYKQTGKAAVDAINVFHPATQFTADLSKIEDEVKRHALKTMIKTFGQMPSQLFHLPHANVLSEIPLPLEDNHQTIADSPSMGEVIGLKWGNYVGSPLNPMPVVFFQKKFSFHINRLLSLPTNDVMLLPRYSSPLVAYNHSRNMFINAYYIIFYMLCTWSPLDMTIWIRGQKEKYLFPFENSLLDQICICESIPDYEWLLVGYHSGIIVAFQLKLDKNFDLRELRLRDQPQFFLGHETTITSITINNNYNVALSTDRNGVCIVWDMNKQQYLRTIMDGGSDGDNTVTSAILSTISNTMGDLAVITHSYHPRKSSTEIISSKLSLFTLNGTFIGDMKTEDFGPYFTALCYSNCQEGLSINVIATGLSDGTVKLWSSWDLTLVRTIPLDLYPTSPIKSIQFSFKCDQLYIINEDNCLIALRNVPVNQSSSSQSASFKSLNFRLINLTNFSQS